MQLKDYLLTLANLWCDSTGRTLVALGGVVQRDGKFLTQLVENPAASLTVRTFEKFLAFFRDASNWPDNVIPPDAVDILDRLDGIATDMDQSSTGQSGNMSPREQERAA